MGRLRDAWAGIARWVTSPHPSQRGVSVPGGPLAERPVVHAAATVLDVGNVVPVPAPSVAVPLSFEMGWPTCSGWRVPTEVLSAQSRLALRSDEARWAAMNAADREDGVIEWPDGNGGITLVDLRPDRTRAAPGPDVPACVEPGERAIALRRPRKSGG